MDGLLIGRFQPFHLGHLDAVLFGLSRTENLFVGIGSSNKSNERKNPFSAEERTEMIISSIESSMMIGSKFLIYLMLITMKNGLLRLIK